jgi:hypothetical protein
MTLLCSQCIDRVHPVHVAGERLQRAGRIGPSQLTSVVLLCLHLRELLPGPVSFQVAPHSRHRVQRRTLGGPPHAPDALRPPTLLGGVCTTSSQQKAVQTVGGGLGMQIRPSAPEALARGRGHCPRALEPGEDVPACPQGLDLARRKASAVRRQHAPTPFVRAEHAHPAGILRRADARDRPLPGRRAVPHSRRVCGCDWGAAPCAGR